MKSRIFLTLAALALPQEASAQVSTHSPDAGLAVEHAEIILSAPRNAELRGYLSIWNGGETSIDLVEVVSETFETVEIHRTVADEGILRKRRIRGGLFIPPRSDLVMQPDGMHLSMKNPAIDLAPGSSLPLVVRFADGVELRVDAEVRPAGSSVADHHHGSGADSDMPGEGTGVTR